jgi:hypothetical protein
MRARPATIAVAPATAVSVISAPVNGNEVLAPSGVDAAGTVDVDVGIVADDGRMVEGGALVGVVVPASTSVTDFVVVGVGMGLPAFAARRML